MSFKHKAITNKALLLFPLFEDANLSFFLWKYPTSSSSKQVNVIPLIRFSLLFLQIEILKIRQQKYVWKYFAESSYFKCFQQTKQLLFTVVTVLLPDSRYFTISVRVSHPSHPQIISNFASANASCEWLLFLFTCIFLTMTSNFHKKITKFFNLKFIIMLYLKKMDSKFYFILLLLVLMSLRIN